MFGSTIFTRLKRRACSERGQSMAEYMLTISAIVVFVVASSYFGFIPSLEEGITNFGSKYETYYAQPGGPQP